MKLKELVVYMLHKCPGLDLVSLCSLAHLIDTAGYVQNGVGMSGTTYIKGRRCPVPKGISKVLLSMRQPVTV
jgi:hypothetical protein